MRRTELDNCSFVKSVLMILVVLYHSCVFWTGNWFVQEPVIPSEFLALFAQYLNSFHIYGFTLVSGYLFSYLKLEKGKYQNFLPFAAGKAKRLLIPYAFVAAVWVIPVSVCFSGFDAKALFEKYVLATAPSQLWFLVMLFGVFMMVWPLSGFFAKHDIAGAVIAVGIYGVGLLGGLVLPNVFSVWTACKYVVFFWLGFKLRQKGTDRLYQIPTVVWLIADVLLFAAAWWVSDIEGRLFTLLQLMLEFAAHIVGAIMAFVMLQRIAARFPWRNSRLFRLLERNSMPVYLFHQQVIYFVLAPLNGVLDPNIHMMVNFATAMCVSLIMSWMLRKSRVTRFLMGEKQETVVSAKNAELKD